METFIASDQQSFNKQKLVRQILGLLIFGFCIYFIVDSVSGSNYDEAQVAQIKNKMYSFRGLLLLVSVALLSFVNWLIEAIKWKFLLKRTNDIPLKLAYLSVLSGLALTIITPFRAGSFIGKVWMFPKEVRIQAALASVFGGLAQLFITVILGLIGLSRLAVLENYLPMKYVVLFSGLLFMIISFVYFYPSWIIEKLRNLFKDPKIFNHFSVLNSYSNIEKYKVLLYSLSRYLVFLIQYYTLLYIFNVDISFLTLFWPLTLVFFVVSVIPSILFGIGVRESAAIIILGGLCADYSILSASLLLWLINMVLPSFIGAAFFILRKKTVS